MLYFETQTKYTDISTPDRCIYPEAIRKCARESRKRILLFFLISCAFLFVTTIRSDCHADMLEKSVIVSRSGRSGISQGVNQLRSLGLPFFTKSFSTLPGYEVKRPQFVRQT